MNIGTNLLGRLRNTKLSKSRGLLPLFEAIVNSIHGLEKAGVSPEDGRINVYIERESNVVDFTDNQEPSQSLIGDIYSFRVVDNGIGFTKANFNSFKILDTGYKVNRGGRGTGRLLWLKAFDRVKIESCYINTNDEPEQRNFMFSRDGITDHTLNTVDQHIKPETSLHLVDSKKDYRENTRKTKDAIAKSIVEHCLWYFARPSGAPKIIVHDEDEKIFLDDLYEDLMHTSTTNERIEVKGNHLDLLHVQLRASSSSNHLIAYCADDRLVTMERLSKYLSGISDRLTDQEGGMCICAM